MTPDRAKTIAKRANYQFYWDYSLQMYACYPQDCSEPASYHTRSTLEDMTPEAFTERFIEPNKPKFD